MKLVRSVSYQKIENNFNLNQRVDYNLKGIDNISPKLFDDSLNDKNELSVIQKKEMDNIFGIKHELWFTRVFLGYNIQGNITPVFLTNEKMSEEQCQKIARLLVMSDSAFIFNYDTSLPTILSFSPYEELTFCTQTLLAAASICNQKDNKKIHQFKTKNGNIDVIRGKENIWWISMELPHIIETTTITSLFNHLKISQEYISNAPCITGVGRQRLYIPIKSIDQLQQISLNNKQVMDFCKLYNLTGICLFTMNDSKIVKEIKLRVFTTSLDGKEDAATGGAALGLLSYLQFYKIECESEILVKQGNEETTHLGQIFLKFNDKYGFGEIGGCVNVISKGNLYNEYTII